MARHLAAWSTPPTSASGGAPVSTCPLWFTSELNGKDHIERTADTHSMSVCEPTDWSGLAASHSVINTSWPLNHSGWTLPKHAVPAWSYIIIFDDLPVPSSQPSGPSATPLLETMCAAIDNYEVSS